MSTITVLGAGAMGSALCTPLVDAGHDVRLWGTWLDDHLIDAVRAGKNHPRTDVALAAGVQTFYHGDLEQALAGAEYAVIAVASVGVEPVTRAAGPFLAEIKGMPIVSKGFAVEPDGTIQLLPQTMERVLAEFGIETMPIIAVGGPCKANEVAARQPTAPLWAASEGAEEWARRVGTPVYRPGFSTDIDGVEICAALKNVIAIALGVADGLTEVSPVPYHDLKAAIFAQGLAELRVILDAEPTTDPWTALGLAGAGDLEVTGLSGRNKVYGARLGRGEGAKEALAAMEALEQTVEGVAAVKLVMTWIQQRHAERASQLPLLHGIYQVVHADAPLEAIIDAALPPLA